MRNLKDKPATHTHGNKKRKGYHIHYYKTDELMRVLLALLYSHLLLLIALERKGGRGIGSVVEDLAQAWVCYVLRKMAIGTRLDAQDREWSHHHG